MFSNDDYEYPTLSFKSEEPSFHANLALDFDEDLDGSCGWNFGQTFEETFKGLNEDLLTSDEDSYMIDSTPPSSPSFEEFHEHELQTTVFVKQEPVQVVTQPLDLVPVLSADEIKALQEQHRMLQQQLLCQQQIQQQQQFELRQVQQLFQHQQLIARQGLMLQYQHLQSPPVLQTHQFHKESPVLPKCSLDSYTYDSCRSYTEPLGSMTSLNTNHFGIPETPQKSQFIPVDISGNLTESQYNKIFKKYHNQLHLRAHPSMTEQDLDNIKVHGRMYFLKDVKTIVPKIGPWKFNAHLSPRNSERQYNIPGMAITCKVKEWLKEDGLWRLYHYKKGKIVKPKKSR